MKKSLINTLIGLSFSAAVFAEEPPKRWFEVEVIVFERNTEIKKDSEHWDANLFPTLSKKAIDPFALFLDESNFVSATPEASSAVATLSDDEQRLLEQLEAPSNTDNSQMVQDIDVTDELLDISSNSIDKNVITPPEKSAVLEPAIDVLGPTISDAAPTFITRTEPIIDGSIIRKELLPEDFEIAPANELQLLQQVSSLEEHANYNVLLHSAWRMVPDTRRKSLPIRLFAGHNYQQTFNISGEAVLPNESDDQTEVIATSSSNVSTFKTSMNENNNEPVWTLDGDLTIYLEHYLYAKTNLFLRQEGQKEVVFKSESLEPTAVEIDKLSLSSLTAKPEIMLGQESAVASENVEQEQAVEPVYEPFLYSYPMDQLRVIRSGEIHYLDHPKFGLVIQIRKFEMPEKEEIIQVDLKTVQNLPLDVNNNDLAQLDVEKNQPAIPMQAALKNNEMTAPTQQ